MSRSVLEASVERAREILAQTYPHTLLERYSIAGARAGYQLSVCASDVTYTTLSGRQKPVYAPALFAGPSGSLRGRNPEPMGRRGNVQAVYDAALLETLLPALHRRAPIYVRGREERMADFHHRIREGINALPAARIGPYAKRRRAAARGA